MQQGEQPMRIFCKANTALNAAIRGDKVLLVPANPKDESQQWIQDSSYIGKVTDEQGRKAFALVNRATRQALVVVVGEEWWELKLAPYRGHECVEVSMLWSLGVQLDGGFSEVRMLKRLPVTLNALGGLAEEETEVGVFNSEPHNEHAIWKIAPVNE